MNAEVRSQNAEVTTPEPVGDNLKERTRQFALRIIRLFRSLPRKAEARIIGNQLLRSGTSVGANYRAACRSRSRNELIAKIGIVLEEADETVYWLELLRDAGMIRAEKLSALIKEANELTSIFVASLRTAKGVNTGG
jgi:four helix bundle protein